MAPPLTKVVRLAAAVKDFAVLGAANLLLRSFSRRKFARTEALRFLSRISYTSADSW